MSEIWNHARQQAKIARLVRDLEEFSVVVTPDEVAAERVRRLIREHRPDLKLVAVMTTAQARNGSSLSYMSGKSGTVRTDD